MLAGVGWFAAWFLGAGTGTGPQVLVAVLGWTALLLGVAAVVSSAIGLSRRGARRRAALGITLAVLSFVIPTALAVFVLLAVINGLSQG